MGEIRGKSPRAEESLIKLRLIIHLITAMTTKVPQMHRVMEFTTYLY